MSTLIIANAELRRADPIISAALWDPCECTPRLQAEVTAFHELSRILADDRRSALRGVLEIAMSLCRAGSAGVSVLRSGEAGETSLRWEAISGALAAHEGSDATLDFNPCGLRLDAGKTILPSQPERVFSYLRGTQPPIAQNLIVPLHDAGQPFGILWVAHHDATSQVSADAVQLMEQLARQLVLALKLLEQARQHGHALDLLESHRMTQQTLAHALAEERSRRERAEAAESGLRQALELKDAVIREVHHRVKNTIQMAASLWSLHARVSPSVQVRAHFAGELWAAAFARQSARNALHEHRQHAGSASANAASRIGRRFAAIIRRNVKPRSGRSHSIRSYFLRTKPFRSHCWRMKPSRTSTSMHSRRVSRERSRSISGWTDEQTLILRITDDGVGMRSKGGESGLGLKLIGTLAAQLGGTLAFAAPVGAGGTTTTLQWNTKRRRELETRRNDCAPALAP